MLTDLRFALRQAAKSRGYAAVIVITTALAIGACTVVFSILNTIILHPLDGLDADRMVIIRPKDYAGVGRTAAEGRHVEEWLAHAKSFEAIYGFAPAFATSTTGGEAVRIGTRWVRGDLLGVMGVKPARGRGFLPEEFVAGRNKVVLIKDRVWRRALPDVADPIGQTFMINDEPYTIVGVLPPLRDGDTYSASQIDVWAPLVPQDPARPRPLTTEARLKPGVSRAAAEAEINRIAAAAPGQQPGSADAAYTVINKAEFIASKSGPMLWSLFGAVSCVLLIACANVANLMLARATSRQREIAVRAALGAGRWRIVRLLITESLALALLGGALGTLGSVVVLKFVRASGMAKVQAIGEAGTGLYRLPYVELDWQALGFALAATLLAGVLFGVAPALLGSRADLNDVLKEGGRGSSEGRGRGRLRSVFVVAEVALAVVLLAVAGVFLRSFLAVTAIDPGFTPSRAVTFRYMLPPQQNPAPGTAQTLAQRLVERLRETPGVQAVGFGSLPILHDSARLPFEIEGRPKPEAERASAAVFGTSGDYFEAVGVSLQLGRTFTPADAASQDAPSVVVVNASLARRHFPDENPIGKRLALHFRQPAHIVEIVGVVGDVRQNGPERDIADQIYHPFTPGGARQTVIVRGRADADALLASVKSQVRALEPNLVITDDAPLQAVLDNQLAQRRFTVQLLTIFSTLALVIATVGIYAVIAYNVAQRTSEIGVRMALGAQTRDVTRMVLRQGAQLVGVGLICGLGAALAGSRLIEAMLFQTSARDPLALGGVCATLAVVALAACWLPARRAAKVNPLIALRTE